MIIVDWKLQRHIVNLFDFNEKYITHANITDFVGIQQYAFHCTPSSQKPVFDKTINVAKFNSVQIQKRILYDNIR